MNGVVDFVGLCILLAALSLIGSPTVEAIINGELVSIYDAPWTAAVELEAGEGQNADHLYQCQAAILNDMWALTWFRCVRRAREQSDDGRQIVPLERIRVVFGNESRESTVYAEVQRVVREFFSLFFFSSPPFF
ncbi:MAG: hypothetical protein Q8P67_14390 [archaeon]|nr:hypothetical protein [archaeon]